VGTRAYPASAHLEIADKAASRRQSPLFVRFTRAIVSRSGRGRDAMPRGFCGTFGFVLAIGAFVSGVTFAAPAADDSKACLQESGDAAIEACTRAIK